MYNRYISNQQGYTPVDEGPRMPPPSPPPPRSGGALLEKGSRQLKELLKTLHLEKLDSGDLLLLLVVLLLWKDSEDMDLLIALGAALLLGNGEDT